jgi:hypothetical protein
MGCQFSAISKVVAQPVGNHLFPVNAVRRARRGSRRNSATPAQRRSRSVPLCDKNGPFVTSGRHSETGARPPPPSGNREAETRLEGALHRSQKMVGGMAGGIRGNAATAALDPRIIIVRQQRRPRPLPCPAPGQRSFRRSRETAPARPVQRPAQTGQKPRAQTRRFAGYGGIHAGGGPRPGTIESRLEEAPQRSGTSGGRELQAAAAKGSVALGV